MLIQIRYNLGSMKLTVGDNSTIADVKLLIHQKHKIPLESLIITQDQKNNIILNPDAVSLASFGVKGGDTLFLGGRYEKKRIDTPFVNSEGVLIPAGDQIVKCPEEIEDSPINSSPVPLKGQFGDESVVETPSEKNGKIDQAKPQNNEPDLRPTAIGGGLSISNPAALVHDNNWQQAYRDDFEPMPESPQVRAPDQAQRMNLLYDSPPRRGVPSFGHNDSFDLSQEGTPGLRREISDDIDFSELPNEEMMESLRAAGLSEMEIMEALMESKRQNKREKRANHHREFDRDIGRMTQALNQMNMRQESSTRIGDSDSFLSTRPKGRPPPRKILSQAERGASWRAEVAAISASSLENPVETKRASTDEDLSEEARALGISVYELNQQKTLLEQYERRDEAASYTAIDSVASGVNRVADTTLVSTVSERTAGHTRDIKNLGENSSTVVVPSTQEDSETSPLLALSDAELHEQRMLLEEIERAKRAAVVSSSRRQRIGISESAIPVTDAVRHIITESTTNKDISGLSTSLSARDVGSVRSSKDLGTSTVGRNSSSQSSDNNSLDLAAFGIDDDALREQRALMEAFNNAKIVETIPPPVADRTTSIDLAALGIDDVELLEQRRLLASYEIPSTGTSRSSVASDNSAGRSKSTGRHNAGSKAPVAKLDLDDASSSLLDAIAYAEKHYQSTPAAAPPMVRNASSKRNDTNITSLGLDEEELRQQRILMAKYERKDGLNNSAIKPSDVILPSATKESVGLSSRVKRSVDSHSVSVPSHDEVIYGERLNQPITGLHIQKNDTSSGYKSGVGSSVSSSETRVDLKNFNVRPGAPVVIDRPTIGAPRLSRNRSSEGDNDFKRELMLSKDDTSNYELISPRPGAEANIKTSSAPVPQRRKNKDGSPALAASQYIPSIGTVAPIRRIPSDSSSRLDVSSSSVVSSLSTGSPATHGGTKDSSVVASSVIRDYSSMGIRGSSINPSQRPSPSGAPKVHIPVSPKSKQTRMDNYFESSSSVPKGAVSGGRRPVHTSAVSTVGVNLNSRPIPNNLQPPDPTVSVGGTKVRASASQKSSISGDSPKSTRR